MTSLGSVTTTSSAQWRILMNVGREEGTWMPKEWAKTSRLVLPVVVNFEVSGATRGCERITTRISSTPPP